MPFYKRGFLYLMRETRKVGAAAVDFPFCQQHDPQYKHDFTRNRKHRGCHAGKSRSKSGM